MIYVARGDILSDDNKSNVIAHGVNCVGGFGSGVAGAIARKYPHVRQAYLYKFKHDGWKLGDVQLVKIEPQKWIANCATQEDCGWGNKDVVYCNYAAIHDVFKKLSRHDPKLTISCPKIGSGLANGNWPHIKDIIKNVFGAHNEQKLTIYYL